MPDSPEKKAIRTVRRKKIQDLLAVLIFLLLLSYAAGTLAAAEGEPIQETFASGSSKSYVLREQENGVQRIPLEEFLVGALAAGIPANYREETLKAQAVILRSACMEQMETAGVLAKGDGQIGGMEEQQRQKLWGEDFEENEAKYQKAVMDTAGLALTYGNKAVSPSYFRLSAGKTRNGAEIFGENNDSWYISVECPHDMEAEEFLQEKRISRSDFTQKLRDNGIELPEKSAKITLVRDSADYVLSVQCGEEKLEGEKFRKLFDLPSSCFYLKEEKGGIILQTKGVGHGLGFDQYGADLLAADGMDYLELLNYFFEGLTVEKME